MLKMAIVVFAFYAIYLKLVENSGLDISEFIQFSKQNQLFSAKTVLFLVFLSALNWFLEIVKWKILVGSTLKINLVSAAEQSLGALTASIITPNRIGEYGAKAIYYRAKNRKPIVALNFLGNMMQMSTTVIFGVFGLILFQQHHQTEVFNINPYKLTAIVCALIMMSLLILKLRKVEIKGLFVRLISVGQKSKGLSLQKLKGFYKQINRQIYLKGIGLSIMRYLVFSFQFYILLKLLGSSTNYMESMMTISTMYLLASVIPSIFIFDVIIKGSIAVYLFTLSGLNSMVVLSVVTLMWLLNVAFPSILGSYFVLNFKLPK